VDYCGVADLKLEILALLYREFCDRHLAVGTGPGAGFFAPSRRRAAIYCSSMRAFDALDRYFRATSGV